MKINKDNTIGIKMKPLHNCIGASKCFKDDWTMVAFVIPRKQLNSNFIDVEKSIDKTKSLVKATLKSRKASAQAIFDTETNELTVLAGAELGEMTDSPDSAAAKTREIYKDDISLGKTTRDIVFKTPSGAAGFVQGNGMSGWKVWELEDGRLLDDIRPNKGR